MGASNQFYTPIALLPVKRAPWYLLYKGHMDHTIITGLVMQTENPEPPPEFEIDCTAKQPVTLLTDLLKLKTSDKIWSDKRLRLFETLFIMVFHYAKYYMENVTVAVMMFFIQHEK